MNWLLKLKSLFSLKKEIVPEPEPVLTTPPVLIEKEEQHIPEPEEEIIPHWLKNEEALRDEGVIYGLSNTDPQEKLNIIQAVYKKRSAEYIKIQNECNERIGELNLTLEKKNLKLEDLHQKTDFFQQAKPSEENIIRVAVGIAFSIGMCAGNYFLIKDALTYSFPQNNDWISWGVFLAGMFSLYYNTSVFHNNDKLNWRRATEEFGMPFAASLFVFAQVFPHLAWYKSLSYFIFIFFVFLISGKILLSSIAKLKTEITIWKENNSLKKQQTEHSTEGFSQIESLETEIENIRVQKWKIISILNDAETYISQTNAEKESSINAFMSEYNLAKNFKDKNNQISKLLSK